MYYELMESQRKTDAKVLTMRKNTYEEEMNQMRSFSSRSSSREK